MLQTIREHTQGWIAGTIIGIIILTFALWGIHSYFVGGGNNSVVAEVNGIEITKEQLAVAYERMRRKIQIQYGSSNSITAKDETALKQRALQGLVEMEALKQASTVQGYQISDNQIDNYLQSIPEFQVDGQFSVERFQEILSSTLLSTSEFLDLIKTSLLIDQPKLGIIFTSFALPDETKYTIELVNQERSVDYITIPLQHFLTQPHVVSSQAIQAYYTEHKSDFMTPEQVNVDYVELSLKDLQNKVVPTETGLKNLYNENINSFSQPMAWKLADVEIALPANATQNGMKITQNTAEAIADLASKTDMAKLSKQYNGKLNALVPDSEHWITLNQMPVDLQKAVAQLSKPGDVSEPIRTSKGLVIVKVLDVEEPKIQPFDVVKEKVREMYIRQHAEEKFAELRDQLASLAYEHPETLDFASKTLGLPIKTSELFTKEKAGKDISQYKKVRDVAFSNDILNLQNNSDVIQLNPETVIVLHVKSHITSSLLPVKSVSNQIEEKLKTQEAEKRASEFANEIKNKLAAGADPQKIAVENNLTWSKTGYLGRYSTKVDTAILDLAFRMPNPKTNKTPSVYDVTRIPTGYAVVALKDVKMGTLEDKKQNFVFAEQVQNSEGLLEYELYKRSQIDNNKSIEIFQQQ